MKVAVTGANGFVGKALCNYLATAGYEVHAITTSSPTSDCANVIYHFTDSPPSASELELALCDVKVVVHLAGLAHNHSVLSKYRFYRLFHSANICYAQSLAAACVAARVRRIVFVSSHGVNSIISGRDIDLPNNYTISKLLSESIFETSSFCSSLECVILRPPLIYSLACPGNLARLTRLFSYVPFNLFGAFKAKRSFISLDNLLEVLQLSIISPNVANNIYDVADPSPVSVSMLADAFYSNFSRPKLSQFLSRIAFIVIRPVILLFPFGRKLLCESVVDSTSFVVDSGWRPRSEHSPPISLSGLFSADH